MRVEISKEKLGSFIYNAIWLLQEDGWELNRALQEIGITHDEYNSITEQSFTVDLSLDDRYAIAREVEREDKLGEIISRVEELYEGESSYLNGYEASEIIVDQRLLQEILRRWEKAEGWVDNSSYWELLDDCIKDVMKIRTQII